MTKDICQLVVNVTNVGVYEPPCLLSSCMAGLHHGYPINIDGIEDAQKEHEKGVVVRDCIQEYSELSVISNN